MVAAKGSSSSRGEAKDDKNVKTRGASGQYKNSGKAVGKPGGKSSFEDEVQDNYDADRLAEMTSDLMIDQKAPAPIPLRAAESKSEL